jgi:DNA-binding MarR family transcriptional regulator/N-acetylglutamate synthase-like GNAT family acetyltransferase
MKSRQPVDSSAPKVIAEIRQFNRFYTRHLGLLDRQLLDSPFTLTEARVLYELARRESTTASAMAADLGLDLGYLSRILKMFERRRYIKRERSSTDTRQYHIRLTRLGHQGFLPLDKAARMQVVRLIEPLPADRRARLVESMHTIQGLLTAHTVEGKSYQLRGLRPGDIGWVTHRQALLYQQEYGWDISYEALVAEILGGFVKSFDAASESAWIAEQDQKILGSVFLVRGSDKIAKLRLLYVESSARGLGIGRRLVDECIAFARARDYETLTLWTNDVLISARKIYQAAGFRLMGEERHHSFGKDLIGQTWDLALRVSAPTSIVQGAER